MAAQRDFNTISPSAKTLLLLKSVTNIPFAKEAVHLLFSEEDRKPRDGNTPGKAFFGRLLHFENRYWSIDQLMKGTGIKNIMEISSGFSFRGLDKVLHEDVYYIDTDLPDLIADKKEILSEFLKEKGPVIGKLITEPLNALDEDAFLKLVKKFPPGPVCIINEGLLVYFNLEEKEKIASIIYKVLEERGGCWITADVYIKNTGTAETSDYGQYGQKFAKFLAAHHVEENKFESFDAARDFFTQCGFNIDHINTIAYDKLSSLRLLEGKTEITEDIVKQWLKVRETWMLKVKN
ncbi:MAG TPA: hypothetical protein DIT07_05115 [Sphingobacteriaceae bacterium]|nr:hypothetical protein [Sphingobacteriaceae bacterium]